MRPSGGRPSRKVSIAWKVAASLAALWAVAWGAAQVVTQLAHEEHTTVTEYDAAGLTTLDVATDAGSVTVVGTTSDTIRVTAHISDGLRATDERQEVDGDRLVLRTGCPAFFSSFCNVTYTVELPARMDLRIRLDNDDIRVTGVEGGVDAHTDNGNVLVRGSGASELVLSSDNGTVEAVDLRATDVQAGSENGDVDLTFLRPPTAVRATSDNGDVTVEVPDDGTEYAVDVGSDNGSSAAPIRTDPSSRRSITVRSDNGDVLVTYAQG